jgi:hypothetical protein
MEDNIEALLVHAITKTFLQELVFDIGRARGAQGVLELEQVVGVGASDSTQALYNVLVGVWRHETETNKSLGRGDDRETQTSVGLVTLVQDAQGIVVQWRETEARKGIETDLDLARARCAGQRDADLGLTRWRGTHITTDAPGLGDAVLGGPLADLLGRLSGIGSLDGHVELNIDREVPATVHAALGRHVDPRADLDGIDQGTDIVETVNLALGSTDVPEEVDHLLNENVLRTSYSERATQSSSSSNTSEQQANNKRTTSEQQANTDVNSLPSYVTSQDSQEIGE